VPGNLNPAWPASGPTGGPPSLTAFLGQLASALIDPPWAVALLGSIGVTAVVLTRRQVQRMYRDWGLRLQVIAAVASAALVAILLLMLWGAGSATLYSRFWAPLVMAAVLLPLVLINRSDAGRSRVTAMAACATFALVSLAVAADPIQAGQTVQEVARDTFSGQVFAALSGDRYASVRDEYAQAAALIPAGAKVLAAVDAPSLLVSGASDLSTLDLPGATSPRPHLPYFQGTQAKLAWLRGHGYSYIVAVDPADSPCLYNAQHPSEYLAGKLDPPHAAWVPYYSDWFAFLKDVSNPTAADSVRVGSLIVVRL
jgi:hypothetical protein